MLAVQSCPQKYFPSRPTQITRIFPASHPSTRGVSRSSRTLGWDAVDAAASGAQRNGGAGWRKACELSTARRRPILLRTAKPCGPGTRCWCQVGGGETDLTGLANLNPPMTVTRRIRRRGERGISRKAIAQGMPDASAEPVCSCAPSSHLFAHETAGAARTRHSLHPLSFEGYDCCKTRADRVARTRSRI
jgi:hypothetical protein